MKEKIIIYFMILSLLLVSGFTGCSRNTGGNGRTPGSNNELLDCNWVLNVDQTIPVKDQDGMTVEYTLVLIAEK